MLRISDHSGRVNALFPSDYAFRDIYLLASATEDEPDTDERAIHGLEGWIACYEKCRLAGTVFAGGAPRTPHLSPPAPWAQPSHKTDTGGI